MDEKMRMKLLGDLIYQMQKLSDSSTLGYLNVRFYCGAELITDEISLVKALGCMYNDDWHYADFDLDTANKVEIFTI